LHLEIRFSSSGKGEYKDRFANPLLFMSEADYATLKSKVENSPPNNVNFQEGQGISSDPLKQISPILRGGSVLWK